MYQHFFRRFERWIMNENVWKTGILIAGGFQALGILQLHNNGVCKDANRWWGLPFRVFQTQFLCLVNYSTGLKTRGYSPLRASRLPDAFEPLSNELWAVSFMTKEHKFRINSKLTTHCSLLKGRLEDGERDPHPQKFFVHSLPPKQKMPQCEF